MACRAGSARMSRSSWRCKVASAAREMSKTACKARSARISYCWLAHGDTCSPRNAEESAVRRGAHLVRRGAHFARWRGAARSAQDSAQSRVGAHFASIWPCEATLAAKRSVQDSAERRARRRALISQMRARRAPFKGTGLCHRGARSAQDSVQSKVGAHLGSIWPCRVTLAALSAQDRQLVHRGVAARGTPKTARRGARKRAGTRI